MVELPNVNPPTSTPLLRAINLSVEVAEQPLISNFNMRVEAGGLIELKGSNGSGKTTLMRTLAGIRRASAGSIERVGESFVYLGQKAGLNESMTSIENLGWYARLTDQSATDTTLRRALDDLGLRSHTDKPIGSLSAGQARRCALARLAVSKSQLWLLDEPLTSLDESAMGWLRSRITAHRSGGGAAVVATHTSLNLEQTTTIDLDAS